MAIYKYSRDFYGEYLNASAPALEEFDTNGNLVHWLAMDGSEGYFEYDENGNCIYEYELLTEKGYEVESWYEYDDRKNLIHMQNTVGNFAWWKFDESNNCIQKIFISKIHRNRRNNSDGMYEIIERIMSYDVDGILTSEDVTERFI